MVTHITSQCQRLIVTISSYWVNLNIIPIKDFIAICFAIKCYSDIISTNRSFCSNSIFFVIIR